MKKNKSKVLVSYCLLGSLILCGCNSSGYEAPELVEPVTTNEAYRPVEYGSIGDVAVYNGVVAPTEHCHFFSGTTNVAEVKVNIGDYVEKGDILAVADTEGAAESIADINAAISLNTRTWEIKEQIYEQSKLELEYKLLGYEEAGDTENSDSIATQIAILEENHSYDELLNKYMLEDLQERLTEAKSLETNSNLVARCSGYVTYIKDFADSDMVSSGENVVIISDYEDTYVKLDVYTNERITENYHYFYAVIDGKRYELEPYEYLPVELSMAQAKGLYLNERMKLSGDGNLPEVGSDFSVLFYRELSENVLIIGKDSVYEDDKGEFVYVKTNAGKEMRYVELGSSDTNYVEVLSGLSEGEWVYYTSSAVIPEKYDEYTVSLQDYAVYGSSDFYTVDDSKRKKIFSQYEGQITEVYVEQGDMVEKGQLICTVKTNEGSALLTEMSNSIDSFKSSYSDSVKAYEEAIALKEQEIADAYIASQTPPAQEEVATDTDATIATATDTEEAPKYEPYYYEQLCCQLEVMKLNHEIEKINYDYNLVLMEENYNDVSCNNDGNGTIMVYADAAGKLSNVNIKVGKNIYVGDRLFNIEIPSKYMIELRVENVPADNLYVNQTVEFVNPTTNKSYTGTVIGTTGSMDDFYFTDIDEKIYMTSNITNGDARYYIEMPEEFYEAPKDYVAGYPVIYMKDAIVVPKDAIYTEEQVEKLYYYVWKIVDGEYVKQYVQLLATDGKTVSEVCVLSGLKSGDVIVTEKGEE